MGIDIPTYWLVVAAYLAGRDAYPEPFTARRP
jgi:hypothetical protein